MELCVPSHRASNKCNVHVKLLDLRLQPGATQANSVQSADAILAYHQVLKEASRLYAESWVRDIGPDLRPNNYEKDDGTEGKSNGDKRSTGTEPSTLEDIGEELYFVISYLEINRGGFLYLLASTPELWTLVLSHRTQILYIADISFVIMYLEVVPGCLVLESGTGSGSLTTLFARAVAPTGHVYTFDFHEQRAASARFKKSVQVDVLFEIQDSVAVMLRKRTSRGTGISTLVTMGVRDIQGEGFPDQFSGLADSVFLDLPQPWLAIPSDLTLQVNDGIPPHALHARGGCLQVKQVWGACSNSHGLAISLNSRA
ncbi:hypothetical protein GOBAR_AA26432 [Gossypium barbadense]|uniref:tRNA (adenine(58)-N(1))-methyltransferase n=1 Tax=Gossypium barbadense TaxID=3634 RepID=A0A2P5WT30_GOSBA|nr:hypothetical protein GOBAR_AA26432 [Gossypium barbadense]